MEQIYKKVERYLKREFPDKQIIKGNGNNCLSNSITDYYGTGGMLIIISEQGDKIYYQISKKKQNVNFGQNE